MIIFFKKIVKYYLKIFILQLHKFVGGKYKWSILYTTNFDLNSFQSSKWCKIENPPNGFFADPFLFKFDDTQYLFVEEFSYKKKKAHISLLKYENNDFVYLGCVLSEECHLSFPFVFVHNNEFYMIPETSALGAIRLYKSMNFPYDWIHIKDLVCNVKSVDSFVIYSDRWYLFTNLDSSNGNEFASEMAIYCSDDILEDDFIPFIGNPVILNVDNSRNGGIFSINSKYYRVSQIRRNGFYGAGIDINEISHLSFNNYKELKVNSTDFSFINNSLGGHSLSVLDNFAVCDILTFKN